MKPEKQLDFPVHSLVANRWSPRSFSDRTISESDLRSILEAARWAPSAFNEQPWRFIYGFRDSAEFQKIYGCLLPGNQPWTSKAAALVVTVAKEFYSKTQKPNKHAWHDLGLSVMSLCIEATSRNIYLHQMAGIDSDKIKQIFELPEGYSPVAIMALGYLGDPKELEDTLRSKEQNAQVRLKQNEFSGNGIFKP